MKINDRKNLKTTKKKCVESEHTSDMLLPEIPFLAVTAILWKDGLTYQ